MRYYCDACGASFTAPKILKLRHTELDEGVLFEELPVCPVCGESSLVQMVLCSCCNEWTPSRYIKTDDGRVYCENCFHWEEPVW